MMSDHAWAPARLDLVARFPEGFFLENQAMRSDRSILVTVLNKRELWYVPPVDGELPVQAIRIATFQENPTGIAEIAPDVFLIATGNFYTTHESHLRRLDLRGWLPGTPVESSLAYTFPPRARGLNGMCSIAPTVILVADCFASLIWRVDLDRDGGLSARVWLEHDSMGYFPGAMKPEQPGVNGIRYDKRRSHIYYTSTAKKLLMRVHVNPWTHQPDSEPELVVAGRMGDDFCIDEDKACLYLATHRQNTLDRVSMDPAVNSNFTDSVAGDPFDEDLIGPTGMIWGNRPGEAGRIGFLLSDGGTASPPPGGRKEAKMLRVTLAEEPAAVDGLGSPPAFQQRRSIE